jgi:hypothetical protein
MVSAKDDSLPTDAEVFEADADADADEAVVSCFNGHDAEVRSPRARILAVLDRKTCGLSLLMGAILQVY